MNPETKTLDIFELEAMIQRLEEVKRSVDGKLQNEALKPFTFGDSLREDIRASEDRIKELREILNVRNFSGDEAAEYRELEKIIQEQREALNRTLLRENYIETLIENRDRIEAQIESLTQMLDDENIYREERDKIIEKLEAFQQLHQEIDKLEVPGIDRAIQLEIIRNKIINDTLLMGTLNEFLPSPDGTIDAKTLEKIKNKLEDEIEVAIEELNLRNGVIDGDALTKDARDYRKKDKELADIEKYVKFDAALQDFEKLVQAENDLAAEKEKMEMLLDKLTLLELHRQISELIDLLNIPEATRMPEQQARIDELKISIPQLANRLKVLKVDLPDDLTKVSELEKVKADVEPNLERNDDGTIKVASDIENIIFNELTTGIENLIVDVGRLRTSLDEYLKDENGNPIEPSVAKASIEPKRDELKERLEKTTTFKVLKKDNGSKSDLEIMGMAFTALYEELGCYIEKYQKAGYTKLQVHNMLMDTATQKLEGQTLRGPAYNTVHIDATREKLGEIFGELTVDQEQQIQSQTQSQVAPTQPASTQPQQSQAQPAQSTQPTQVVQGAAPQVSIPASYAGVRPVSVPTNIEPIQTRSAPVESHTESQAPSGTDSNRIARDGDSTVRVLNEETISRDLDIGERIKNLPNQPTRVDETKMYRYIVQDNKLCYVEEDLAPMLANPEAALKKEITDLRGKLERMCKREGKTVRGLVGQDKYSVFAQLLTAKKGFLGLGQPKEVKSFLNRFAGDPDSQLKLALALKSAVNTEQLMNVVNSPYNAYETVFGKGTCDITTRYVSKRGVEVVKLPSLAKESMDMRRLTPTQRADIGRTRGDKDLIRSPYRKVKQPKKTKKKEREAEPSR